MKINEVLLESELYDNGSPNQRMLRHHKARLNAFYYEIGSLGKQGNKLVTRYRFYSVEEPKRLTRKNLAEIYHRIPVKQDYLTADRAPRLENGQVLVYGAESPETAIKTETYLKEHGLEMPLPPFQEKQKDSSYPELQKALFFAERMKCPILFVSIHEEIKDVRFLGLLRKSNVRFSCMDFPHFCRENLSLIMAMGLYGDIKIPI